MSMTYGPDPGCPCKYHNPGGGCMGFCMPPCAKHEKDARAYYKASGRPYPWRKDGEFTAAHKRDYEKQTGRKWDDPGTLSPVVK